MFWGLSPALDLLDQYLRQNKTLPGEFNILLIGGSDARHILQTLARRYRHHALNTTINFFVAELTIEPVAKQLLLLNVALQDSSLVGIIPKTRIFMELFGNTLIRPSVAKFLTTTGTRFVDMVTDYELLAKTMPFITLNIKYKERDHLENLFKFWCGQDKFDICDCWDRRLRKSLGVRYDTRSGVFDWDLHMRLHSIGGKQICSQEYRSFRSNGVAFNWLESEVSKPNRSMVCLVFPNGDSFVHYGYLGDMQTGPFVAYGLQCEDGEYLKSSNGQNLHRATDVTERNLCQIFHEIEHNEAYCHRSTSDLKMGPVTMQIEEKPVVDVGKSDGKWNRKNKCMDLKNVKITFVSISMLELMKYKGEYENFFDLTYFGCFFVKYLCRNLINRVVPKNGLIVIENQKFILSHREKQLREFADEIKKAMDGVQVKELPFDHYQDSFATFVKL